MSVGKNKRLRHQAVKRASPGGVSIHRQNKMFSRNLSVPDFMRRFFVSCTQISEAYAVRTVMKFGCDWRKIGHKGRYRKDSERTLYFNLL